MSRTDADWPGQVDAILAHLQGGPPPEAGVLPLDGGITNRNFRLDWRGERFVLRVGGHNTQLLGIDRGREHTASRIAGTLGIGAEVVWTDAARDVMVTRFIEGPTLTPESAAVPATLDRIVAALQTAHRGPPFPGRFSAFEAARELHRLALEHGVLPPAELGQALALLDRIEKSLPALDPLVPCHNDLLPGNFIDDGRRIRIIDWEYAAMGDPFFDLGNLAVNLSLDEPACRTLLARYFGACRDQHFARLVLMRMASDMRESCWGFLQLGLSKLDFDFQAYGLRHLQRFLSHASESDFTRQLSRASGPPTPEH